MKYRKLKEMFRMTADIGNAAVPESLRPYVTDDFVECVEELGGKTFGGGLYREYRAK